VKYRALATDFDGTIAHDGRVDLPTLDALRRVRAARHRLLLVTGRELTDLFNTFSDASVFDCIVAENGAVLYDPAACRTTPLAPAAPRPLVDVLTRQNVPLSVGHSIVATVQPYEHQVLAAIRDLGLAWHVIFNKGSVMALPSEVTKAVGLTAALSMLELGEAETIGAGDAENDQAFLSLCGLPVAVANALPVVKQLAYVVTANPSGAGIVELVDRWLAGSLDAIAPRRRDPYSTDASAERPRV
jgi:hydroxymethylpyrimidine pyrophosphatase-like HAD family hydrolase